MTHKEHAKRRLTIAREIKAGKEPGAVARKFGVGLDLVRCAVRTHLKRPLVDVSARTRTRQAKIAKEVAAGKAIQDIALRHRVSVQTVRTDVIHETGRPFPQLSKYRVRGKVMEVLAALLLTQKSLSEIGREQNISRQAVNYIGLRAAAVGLKRPKVMP